MRKNSFYIYERKSILDIVEFKNMYGITLSRDLSGKAESVGIFGE